MTGPVCPHCGDLARGCACPPGPYVGEDAMAALADVALARASTEAWGAGYAAAAQEADPEPGLLDRVAMRLWPADQLARIAFGEGAEACHVARRLGEDVATDAAAGVYGPQLATLYRVADERDSLRIDLALATQASDRVARAARAMITARWARETAPGDVDAAEALAQAEVHLKALLGPEDERDSARNLLAETEAALCAEIRRLKAELHREREANRPLRHEVEQARARVATVEQAVATLRDARQRADALASSGTVAMVEAYEVEDAAVVALLALLPENGT